MIMINGVKSKSMCLGSERICPGSHPRISGNQVGVPKLYMDLWNASSMRALSKRIKGEKSFQGSISLGNNIY